MLRLGSGKSVVRRMGASLASCFRPVKHRPGGLVQIDARWFIVVVLVHRQACMHRVTEGADAGLIINMSPLLYCRAHTIPVIYARPVAFARPHELELDCCGSRGQRSLTRRIGFEPRPLRW